MDAGELGSRHLSVAWIEVPADDNGDADLCILSIQSPPVTLSEVFGSQLAADVSGAYEDDE